MHPPPPAWCVQERNLIMPESFRVHVNSYGLHRNLTLRWTDPNTGVRHTKSAGTSNRREAERRAGALQRELTEGRYFGESKLPWRDFTWRYCDEVVPGLAEQTGRKVNTVFAAVERILHPRRLAGVTAGRVSSFASKLREEGKSEATIQAYLAHLHSALAWAVDVGLLRQIPKFPKIKRAKGQKMMKGRPITAEELDRMLAAIPGVLTGQDRKRKRNDSAKPRKPRKPKEPISPNPAAVASWEEYLRGLWWSGLRLGESITLAWERRAGFSVDLTGKHPMFRIRAEWQKSHREELCPIAPEFAEWLLAIPEAQRHGRVFRLLGQSGSQLRDPVYVSAVVTRIGKTARVVVDERTKRDRKTGEVRTVVKYASAHDLRRSFGFRWSRRILPAELKELMRHADIQTTMLYYVGQEAETTGDALWAAYRKATNRDGGRSGNISGNMGPTVGQSNQPQETTKALG